MILDEPFDPLPILRNHRLQTFLASFRLRALGRNPMRSSSRPMILQTGGGTRLLGVLSKHHDSRAKGMVVLIHGWEGGADSTYMLTAGRMLFRNGYDLFRLNLRDHGGSHHLNEGLFFATLFREVFRAVRQVADLAGGLPVFLVGFSLGGNYALRIARHCAVDGIPRLRHVLSVSPVLNPSDATDRIERDPMILRYFLKKWKRSLRRKQALFPRRYDFSGVLRLGSIREITSMLLSAYTEFDHPDEYFDSYALKGRALVDIPVPTTILTAADDPIIPVGDFHRLRRNDLTRLVVHTHGGHLGFIENLSMACWHERKMVQLFDAVCSP